MTTMPQARSLLKYGRLTKTPVNTGAATWWIKLTFSTVYHTSHTTTEQDSWTSHNPHITAMIIYTKKHGEHEPHRYQCCHLVNKNNLWPSQNSHSSICWAGVYDRHKPYNPTQDIPNITQKMYECTSNTEDMSLMAVAFKGTYNHISN